MRGARPEQRRPAFPAEPLLVAVAPQLQAADADHMGRVERLAAPENGCERQAARDLTTERVPVVIAARRRA